MSKLSLFLIVLVAMVFSNSVSVMGRFASPFSAGVPQGARIVYRKPNELPLNLKSTIRTEHGDSIGAYLNAAKEMKEIGGINLSEHLIKNEHVIKSTLQKNDFLNKKPLARAKEIVHRMIAMYKRK